MPFPSWRAVTDPTLSLRALGGKTNKFESLKLAGVSSSSAVISSEDRGGRGKGTGCEMIATRLIDDGFVVEQEGELLVSVEGSSVERR